MCNNKQHILWWVKWNYGLNCGRSQLTRVIGQRNYDFFCQHIFTHKNITAKISNSHFYGWPTLTVNILSQMKQTKLQSRYVCINTPSWRLYLKLAHNVLQFWKYVVRLHPLISANDVSTGWMLLLRERWTLPLRESWTHLLRESWMLLLRESWILLLQESWTLLLRECWMLLLREEWMLLLQEEWMFLLQEGGMFLLREGGLPPDVPAARLDQWMLLKQAKCFYCKTVRCSCCKKIGCFCCEKACCACWETNRNTLCFPA